MYFLNIFPHNFFLFRTWFFFTYDHIMWKIYPHKWNVEMLMWFSSCESQKKKKDQDLQAELEKRKMSSCFQFFWTEASSVWSFDGFNTFLYTTHTSWETPAIHTDTETSAGSKHGSAWIKNLPCWSWSSHSSNPMCEHCFSLSNLLINRTKASNKSHKSGLVSMRHFIPHFSWTYQRGQADSACSADH